MSYCGDTWADIACKSSTAFRAQRQFRVRDEFRNDVPRDLKRESVWRRGRLTARIQWQQRFLQHGLLVGDRHRDGRRQSGDGLLLNRRFRHELESILRARRSRTGTRDLIDHWIGRGSSFRVASLQLGALTDCRIPSLTVEETTRDSTG